MKRTALVIYIPAIHKGYLELLERVGNTYKNMDVYLIDKHLLKESSKYEPNIAYLNVTTVKKLLIGLGFKNMHTLSKRTIKTLEDYLLIMVQDEISRKLALKYFPKKRIVWENSFLRWDREKVIAQTEFDVRTIASPKHKKFMKNAYTEAEKSSDWWRQVGAVAVDKKGTQILKAYNRGLPDDHAPYQVGGIRDYLEVGEKPELSTTIHAEQAIISEAARRGIKLQGTSIYVTHFPCSVCSKLIAEAGIAKCFFSEGSANSDGRVVLESAHILIQRILL